MKVSFGLSMIVLVLVHISLHMIHTGSRNITLSEIFVNLRDVDLREKSLEESILGLTDHFYYSVKIQYRRKKIDIGEKLWLPIFLLNRRSTVLTYKRIVKYLIQKCHQTS